MDFAFDERTDELRERAATSSWSRARLPGRAGLRRAGSAGDPDPWTTPPVVDELKAEARERGLWNLFLPARRTAPG